MKPSSRISLILALVAGILTVSSPNYAGTLIVKPALGIRKSFPAAMTPKNTVLRNPASLEKKKAMDPYVQALKIARALSTSA